MTFSLTRISFATDPENPAMDRPGPEGPAGEVLIACRSIAYLPGRGESPAFDTEGRIDRTSLQAHGGYQMSSNIVASNGIGGER